MLNFCVRTAGYVGVYGIWRRAAWQRCYHVFINTTRGSPPVARGREVRALVFIERHHQNIPPEVKWCMKREVENRLLRRLRGPFTKVKAVTLWAPHGHVSWPSFAGWSAGNAWRAARSWAIDMLGRVSSSNWNFFSFI